MAALQIREKLDRPLRIIDLSYSFYIVIDHDISLEELRTQRHDRTEAIATEAIDRGEPQ